MADELIRVQLARPERNFIKVYKDFFRTPLLSPNEKLIYIALKGYLNYSTDTGEVFPSIQTLCKDTGMDRKTVMKVLKNLEDKHVIKRERRGLTKSNLYTLMDNPQMWQAKNEEELATLSESEIQYTTEEMLEELQRRGAIEIIKKESPSSGTDQSSEQADSSKQLNIISTIDNSITPVKNCQYERYSLEQIKELYEYDVLIHDKPAAKVDYDVVMNLLYDTLNTTKKTIRVSGEDKATMLVVGRLMKLDREEIQYCIDKYSSQTEKINNPTAYMLTLLYKAHEQMHLEVSNQVQHLLYGNKD